MGKETIERPYVLITIYNVEYWEIKKKFLSYLSITEFLIEEMQLSCNRNY